MKSMRLLLHLFFLSITLKSFQKFFFDYFNKRKEFISAFLLIDIRHEPQPIDLDFLRWLGKNYIPFSIVFTKADKIKEKEIEKKVSDYMKELERDWESQPQYFITSSKKRLGKDSLLNHIHEINQSIKKN